MSSFTERQTIDAPIGRVWTTLADIGSIADWNPGLAASHATSDTKDLGATRHCVIDDKHSLDEEVVDFEPIARITFRVTRSSMPIKRADIRFALKKSGARTEVIVSPDYEIKYGPIGRLLDMTVIAKT